jgi:hypothetical protein
LAAALAAGAAAASGGTRTAGVAGLPMREAHHWPASALASVIAMCVSGTSKPYRVIPSSSSVDNAVTW